MRRPLAILLGVAFALLALSSPAAAAEFGLNSFDVSFVGPKGLEVSQAGSHPYAMVTSFKTNTEEVGGEEFPVEATRDLNLFQVPGFVGDLTAVPQCPIVEFFITAAENATGCSDSTAVGLIETEIGTGEAQATAFSPLYNLVPPPGKVAKLGFKVFSTPITIDLGVSEAPPHEVVATSANISQALEFFGAKVTIWGVPADPSHDEERGLCYKGGTSCPAGVPPRPFLTLPRACEGPLESRYELDSWKHPGVWAKGGALTHDDAKNPQGMVGCGKLGFAPNTSVQPSSTSAESSAGIDVNVDVNDEGLKNAAPSATAQADIEKIVTRFPTGITANPSAAEGLGVCTKLQYEAEALETGPGQGCPEAAKLGSVEAQTPLLKEHPLHGSIYLAQQDNPETAEPGAENPFDSLLALYLVIRDPELGIFVKQAGEVSPDEKTGQLVSTFANLPPFPLSHVNVHLRSGPRAPLITPSACGTYATEVELTPTSGGPPAHTTSSFTIGSGPGGGPCPAGGTPPFAPGFEAGSANNAAGRYSPFTLRLTRADGEQDLTRFSAVLPPGVVPRIAGVAKCPDAAIEAAKLKSGRAEQASPSCPAASLIGHVTGGAGVGPDLTFVTGQVYLAGPYNGDPLSAVSIVPAVAGPFDVGTVVTRVALTLNPVTHLGEIDGSASDPIPHILKGLPLKLRDLRVTVDRPDFTLTPTSCQQNETAATIFGGGTDVFSPADDVAIAKSSRYQAASCASLPFKPKLSLTLKGGTRRSDHPALNAVLTPRAGDANIGSISTILPHSEFIDPERISNPCTRVQFNENACPPSSVLGTAKAFSPLLDEPLEGPVYFRSNGGERKVPDLVADVHGQGFRIIQVGFVDSVHARIRTRFLNFPDAPVTKILLRLKGGKEGVIVNSADLCAHTRHVKVAMTAQNGLKLNSEPALKVSCKKKH